MPVARDHLCGSGFGHQSKAGARNPLHLGVAAAVDPDRARDLPDADAGESALDAVAVALELEGPARELGAEGDRLGMDAVSSPDHHGGAMLLRAASDRPERALAPV